MPCRLDLRVLAALMAVVSVAPGCAHVRVEPHAPGPFAYFTAPTA